MCSAEFAIGGWKGRYHRETPDSWCASPRISSHPKSSNCFPITFDARTMDGDHSGSGYRRCSAVSRAWLSLDGELEDCERARCEKVRQAALAKQRACDEDGPLTRLTRLNGVSKGRETPLWRCPARSRGPRRALHPFGCRPAIFVGFVGASGSVDRPRGVDVAGRVGIAVGGGRGVARRLVG